MLPFESVYLKNVRINVFFETVFFPSAANKNYNPDIKCAISRIQRVLFHSLGVSVEFFRIYVEKRCRETIS